MLQRSVVRVGVTILATSLALSACGSRGSDTGGSGGAATGGGGGDEKTATIGVIAPLTGDLSALGLGI